MHLEVHDPDVGHARRPSPGPVLEDRDAGRGRKSKGVNHQRLGQSAIHALIGADVDRRADRPWRRIDDHAGHPRYVQIGRECAVDVASLSCAVEPPRQLLDSPGLLDPVVTAKMRSLVKSSGAMALMDAPHSHSLVHSTSGEPRQI